MDTPLDLMVDCGANVGFTARYFLEKFPNLKVICLEPDFSNFVVAKKNLNHYADRINICQNAVWYKPCKTEVIEGHYGNGGKWALQVRETEKEGGVPATDLNIILDGQNADNIFIKIDIEGAEKEVLGKNTKWAKRCNFLAIEVHDEEALKIFNRFADDYNMKNIGLFGEMYLLKNSDR
jgi:FkbM family methyltransferase